MAKGIIKEAVIVLLMLLVIALVLGIIFYDYIPINKTVPLKVNPYKMSSDLEEELGEELEEEEIVKTYTVDSSDLELYENDDYDAGKKNPFSSIDGAKTIITEKEPNGNSDKDPDNNQDNKQNDTQANIKTTK